MMSLTVLVRCNFIFVISCFLVNRNILSSIHFNGRVRGKLTDVCNDASGKRNERPKFLAMLFHVNLSWTIVGWTA